MIKLRAIWEHNLTDLEATIRNMTAEVHLEWAKYVKDTMEFHLSMFSRTFSLNK